VRSHSRAHVDARKRTETRERLLGPSNCSGDSPAATPARANARSLSATCKSEPAGISGDQGRRSDSDPGRRRPQAISQLKMGITEVITARRSPWQNPYAERLIGSIRRECLDHVIIFSERHLRRVLSSYFQYHHDTRTHLSLGKECPRPRPIQFPSAGNIIAFPEVGGLHHRYERRAA
jgi:Integrase core domain